jgi:hypothetical protein
VGRGLRVMVRSSSGKLSGGEVWSSAVTIPTLKDGLVVSAAIQLARLYVQLEVDIPSSSTAVSVLLGTGVLILDSRPFTSSGRVMNSLGGDDLAVDP